MKRSDENGAELRVPSSVESWIRAMSKRVGAPADRVIRVLLDRYVQCLPPSSRQKLNQLLLRRQQDDTFIQ